MQDTNSQNTGLQAPGGMPAFGGGSPTPAPAVGGGVFDPNSIVDFLKSQGKDFSLQGRAKLFEEQGLGTAASYLGAGANNASLNMALLTKLKGFNGASSSGIGGSASVGMNQSQNTAMNAAGNSLVPTQQPVQAEVIDPLETADNPALATFNKQKESAYSRIDTQYKPKVDQLNKSYATTVAGYQDAKKKALAAAEAQYAIANPYGSGSDRTQFMESVGKSYDKLIEEAGTNFRIASQQLESDISTAKANIDTQYEKQLADYQTNQKANFKEYLAGLKIGDGSAPSASELFEAISIAMAGGKSYAQAKSEITNALEYAQRIQGKEDSRQAHQDFMERHTLLMEQVTLERLSRLSEKGGDKELSPSEIKNLKDQYPNLKLDYGMTADEAKNLIQNRPKYELGKISGMNVIQFNRLGIDAGKREEIRSALAKGYTIDEVIAAIPNVTPEIEALLRNKITSLDE